jgi:hypothetical protein
MSSPPYILDWIKQNPTFNTIASELTPSIALDASGNIYGCYSASATAVGSGGGTQASANIFVFKMNASGNVQWTKNDASFNTSLADTVPTIAVDTLGNVVVSYQTAGGVASGGTLTGNGDIVVFKLDTNGNILWIKQDNQINTAATDTVPQVITDSSNNIYLTFTTTGAVSGGTLGGGVTFNDVVLIKLNGSNGQRLWVKQDSTFLTGSWESSASIGLDVSGNPILAWHGNAVLPSGGETLGGDNISVVKFDSSNGARIWGVQKNIFNTSVNDTTTSIAIDSNGNTFVAYQAVAGGVVSGGVSSGNTDIVVFKLDSEGQTVWTKQDTTINTVQADTTVSITVDASGHAYISYQAANPGAISGGVATGSSDVVLIKLDGSNGSRLWGKQNSLFNTSSAESNIKIKADSTNSVFITYITGGVITDGMRTGSNSDIVVAKFREYNSVTDILTPVIYSTQYDTSIFLGWSTPNLNPQMLNDVYITEYKIYDGSDNLVTTLTPTTATTLSTHPQSHIISNLTMGSTYSYYLKVVNNVGVVSNASNIITTTVQLPSDIHVLDWIKQHPSFNTVASEATPGIALDASGNIYGCYAAAATTVGSGGATQATANIFVFKMNASGDIQWIKNDASFNTPVTDTVPSIAVDTLGNVIVSYMAAAGGLAPGAAGGASLGSDNIVIFELNGANGNIIWVKQDSEISSAGSDKAPQVITDSSNNIYLTFSAFAAVSGGTFISTGGTSDIVLIKLNSSGVRQWIKHDSTFNTTAWDDLPTIGLDPSGNPILAWHSSGALPSGGETATLLTGDNISVVKFSSVDGARMWGVQKNIFNTNAGDLNTSIAIDSNGNTIVAYQTASGGVITGGVASGNVDIVVFKLDSSGNTVWTKQDTTINTNQSDSSVSITVDASGNPYIGYQVVSPGFIVGRTSAGGNGDVVLLKLDGATGARIWGKQNYSFITIATDQNIKIKADSSNNVFLTYLVFTGTIPGGTKTGGVSTFDVAVAKFRPYNTSTVPTPVISATPYDSSVIISWSNTQLNNYPSDNMYINYYRIYDASDNLVSELGPYTSSSTFPTSATVSPSDASYSYYMKVVNNYGVESASSNTVSGTLSPSSNEIYYLEWIKQNPTFNTISGETTPGIALDASGNIYGCYSAAATTVGLGGTSQATSNIFVFKMNASGDIQWIKNDASFNTSVADTAPSIAVDTSGNVIVSYVAATGGLAPGSVGGASQGNNDIVLFKLDTNGGFLWAKQDALINSIWSDANTQIITDSQNNIFLTFSSQGTVSGGTYISTAGTTDIVLIKLNSSGVRQWIKQDSTFNTTTWDDIPTIGLDPSGNPILAWHGSGTLPSGGETATLFSSDNISVVKFSSVDGQRIWGTQRNIFNTISSDQRPSIAIDTNGNTFIAYQTGGVVSGGVASGNNDIVVFKLDSSGNTVWTKQDITINTSQADTLASITVDASGNPYIAYQESSGGSAAIPGGTYTGAGDVVLVKLDGQIGIRVWGKQSSLFNTISAEINIKIQVDSLNNVFLTYITAGTVTGGTKTGTNNDIVVAKFKPYVLQPPQGLSIVPGDSQVTLNWTPPQLNLLDPLVYVTNYNIYDASNNLVQQLSATGYTTSDQSTLPVTTTITGLSNNQIYKYYMKTLNSNGILSSSSNVVQTIPYNLSSLDEDTVETSVTILLTPSTDKVSDTASLLNTLPSSGTERIVEGVIKASLQSILNTASLNDVNGSSIVTNVVQLLPGITNNIIKSNMVQKAAAARVKAKIASVAASSAAIKVSSLKAVVADMASSVNADNNLQSYLANVTKEMAQSIATSASLSAAEAAASIITTAFENTTLKSDLYEGLSLSLGGQVIDVSGSVLTSIRDSVPSGQKSSQYSSISTLKLVVPDASNTLDITTVVSGSSIYFPIKSGIEYTLGNDTITYNSLTQKIVIGTTQYSLGDNIQFGSKYYRIDQVGGGTFSEVTAPSAPSGLSATAGNGQLTISFTPGNNGGSLITNYEYSTNGGSSFTAFSPAIGNVSSVTITGLTNGTTYNVKLKAVNVAGAGAESSAISGTPVAPNNGGGGGGGYVPCIVEGQRILTSRGYVKVEELESTDFIITSDNRQVAANVYKFTVDNTTEKTAPITIKAHAFAHNSPPNDIRLSPLHAIQRSKGVWDIPIKAMKRYSNVIQDEPGSSMTYYHIETPNFFKDNLVVEGAIVESFAGNVAKKHNLKATDIYKWSSTLQGYTRTNPTLSKSK